MIVLDTTVLVYLHGATHPLREPCRRLVGAIAEGSIVATTTAEVIQEFTHVRARRTDRVVAARDARNFVDLLSPLMQVDEAMVRAGLELYARSAPLGAFDCLLAAAALASGAAAFVSADRAFGAISGLGHVIPSDDGIARLLAEKP